MQLNHDIRPLKDNEIAGAQTINPIVQYLLGMRSLTPQYMSINPNGRGSVNFNLNFPALAADVLKLVQADNLEHDFKVSIGETTVSVSSGKVLFPSNAASIQGDTFNLSGADGKTVYALLTSQTAGSLQLGVAPTSLLHVSGNSYTMTLPIATLAYSNNAWSVLYHNIGSFEFGNTPYFWEAGYDRTKAQAYMHNANADVAWVTYGDCDESTSA